MKKPVISVVMPCYQNEKTLSVTVESIRRQTFENWELIAVNDGSRDGTGDVLDQLAKTEPRMRVIHQKNGGVSAARNAGLDAAQGEWVFFVDADDVLTDDALQTLLDMTDDQQDIVCAAYAMRYTDEGGREEIHACAEGDLQTVLESLVRGDSALNSMCVRLYRMELLRKFGIRTPVGIAVGEDVLFNLEAFWHARGYRMTDQVIYIYLYGGDSAMTRARKDVYRRNADMLAGIDAFLARNDLQTRLFRAHIDVYLRLLRADRGRLRAAMAMNYKTAGRITQGVRACELPLKQKLYYYALRLMPVLSILLP